MLLLRVVLCAAVVAVAAAVALFGVAVSPRPSELAQLSGCLSLTAAPSMRGEQTVTVVRASACRDPAGRLRSPGEAVDVVARTVWASLRSPVDAFALTVDQGPAAAVAVTLSREILGERFGPGPAGVALPVEEHGPADAIWILLPIGYAVTGVVLVLLARRSSVVVVWFRR